MANYVVSSDNIDGKEQSYIKTVISKLEAKGHTCENAGVGPNTIQSYGLSSRASGKIGVFIVGGVDAGMFVDFVETNYKYKYMWVVFASNTATTDKWLTCKGLSSTPLVRAHDDNYSGSNIASVGKTTKQYFSEHKDKINYVCGKLGCSFDEIATKLANGGESGDEDDGGSSASSIKDAIKEVLSFWDGEVECYVRDNKMYIHKVRDPEVNTPYLFAEGLNLVTDSLTITDYNPDTVNFLTVHWPGGEDIVYRDEKLIARFGEKPLELDAVKKVVVTEESESTSTDNSGTVDSTSTDSTDTTDTVETETTTTETTTKTEEVPVETYEEAVNFANIEWAKIKRDDGHTIECKIIGSDEYNAGEWARVYIPSFDIDQHMYISRISQSEAGDNPLDASISLVDYPPSLGEYQEAESEEETDEEEVVDDESVDEDVDV